MKYALYTLIRACMSDEHSCQHQHVSSDLSHQKGVSSCRTDNPWIYYFFFLILCKEIIRFWNTWSVSNVTFSPVFDININRNSKLTCVAGRILCNTCTCIYVNVWFNANTSLNESWTPGKAKRCELKPIFSLQRILFLEKKKRSKAVIAAVMAFNAVQ